MAITIVAAESAAQTTTTTITIQITNANINVVQPHTYSEILLMKCSLAQLARYYLK